MNFLLIFFLALNIFPEKNKKTQEVSFTILYDNYQYTGNTQSDWGFSCLIEKSGKTILFDTGTKPDIFSKNLESIGVDIDNIDMIIISHNHRDHTGGLPTILSEKSDLPIYIPAGSVDDFLANNPGLEKQVTGIHGAIELVKGVKLTGEMPGRIWEQSLIVETSKGPVVVTGCSHPGIVSIIRKATELSNRNVHMVFGGFHLNSHTEDEVDLIISELQDLGIDYCGPTHCTGQDQIEQFEKKLGNHFIKMGTGKMIVI
jgi:7,8-dihydropterin-6-yl-methyl-4-(beta-D-ribofuranosyl)aminobenzene 5'-phosphate synthase